MGCASIEAEVLRSTATVDVEIQAGDVEVALSPSASLDYAVVSDAEIDTQVVVVPVVVNTEMAQGSIIISFVCTIDVSGETIYYLADKNGVPILTKSGEYIYLSTTD